MLRVYLVISVIILIVITITGILFIPNNGSNNAARDLITPGNISLSSACANVQPGSVFTYVNAMGYSGFKLYNVSGFRDYVISPGAAGNITFNVTRAIFGGMYNQYTNLSIANISDSGISFSSASGEAINVSGYMTVIPGNKIMNLTAPSAGFGFISAPFYVSNFSCGQSYFNISIRNSGVSPAQINSAKITNFLTINKSGRVAIENVTYVPMPTLQVFPGTLFTLDFGGVACPVGVVNYSLYISLNYSLSDQNTSSLASGKIVGTQPLANPFETRTNVPYLTKGTVNANFSEAVPANISAFVTQQFAYVTKILSITNDSGIVNMSILIRLPIYYAHPSIGIVTAPDWRQLAINQAASFTSTFDIASNASEGTYWMFPMISGQRLCEYSDYSLLTIGNSSYNGTVSIHGGV